MDTGDGPDYGQQQAAQELHSRTVEALVHARAGNATDDDLHLLAWLAGITLEELKHEDQ